VSCVVKPRAFRPFILLPLPMLRMSPLPTRGMGRNWGVDAGSLLWNHREVVSGSRFPPLAIAALAAAATTGLALLNTAQAGAALAYAGESVPWNGLLRARLVDWYAYALFVPALVWLARRMPVTGENWLKRLPAWLLLGLPLALAKEALYVAVGNLFRPGMFDLPRILSEDFSAEAATAWAMIGVAQGLAWSERRAGRREAEASSAPQAVTQLSVRKGDSYHVLRASEIEWIEAQGNYARIVTPRGAFLLRETMAGLERQLGPRFARVHRRAIVNLDRVERIEPRSHGEYALVLGSGECVASARSYGARVRALL